MDSSALGPAEGRALRAPRLNGNFFDGGLDTMRGPRGSRPSICALALTLIFNDDLDFTRVGCSGPVGLSRRGYLTYQTVVRFEQ